MENILDYIKRNTNSTPDPSSSENLSDFSVLERPSSSLAKITDRLRRDREFSEKIAPIKESLKSWNTLDNNAKKRLELLLTPEEMKQLRPKERAIVIGLKAIENLKNKNPHIRDSAQLIIEQAKLHCETKQYPSSNSELADIKKNTALRSLKELAREFDYVEAFFPRV